MDHFDVIIGTGAGAARWRIAWRRRESASCCSSGAATFPELENWDSHEVFNRDRYLSEEVWYDGDGQAFKPHQQYFVGGNTKLYGAILFRLRERDFDRVQHYGGVSPAWPLAYQDLEPYYAEAEQLYLVHGQRGEDPTEPSASGPIRTRPSPTSPASRSCTRTSRRPATTRSTCRWAWTSTSETPRRGAACAAIASTASRA